MSDLILKPVQVEIAEKVSRGEIQTADDLVEEYDVPYSQAIALLGSNSFISLVSAMSKAKAQLTWHSVAIPKLIKMVKSDDPKISMQAMTMLGKITDSIKGGDFNININLENLVRQEENSNDLKSLDNLIEMTEYKKVMKQQ